ncbi:STAS domain-containing protein [Actinomycetospora endophytica]|uniref:STAS domain-containing protein n=1 Tax=Actinomycetospora endophytica TaxID=2291215 RepID=A0ABS8P2Y6_9PSEU|nr:STAS domain-containing protein [Actinomycetospora endophytica]MCD2191786.1 STAS domain-containing protein [Actinomycetospora endophytica]
MSLLDPPIPERPVLGPTRLITRGGLMPWPGPAPAALAEGSLVVAVTAPRARTVIARSIGEIDPATAPGWRRTLHATLRVLTATGHQPRPTGALRTPSTLVCDLTDVVLLDPAGVEVLVELAGHCRLSGVELQLLAENSRWPVRQALQSSGLGHGLVVTTRTRGRHRPAVPPL